MTDKVCKPGECLPKEYSGIYRCMVCYKPFVQAEEEDVMNHQQVAPAIARIAELETENSSLRTKLEAMKEMLTHRDSYTEKPVNKGWPGSLVDREEHNETK